MHNMIIKDGENVGLEVCFDVVNIPIRCEFTIDYYTQGSRIFKNANIHYMLHNGIIEHL